MKRTIRITATLAVIAFSCLAAVAAEPAFKSPVAKLNLKDGDSVVFLGDSITHQCLYTQYVEDYFYTRFPNMRLKFHNAGVGGAKAWDALERFESDVAAYKPKYVTVLLGMNDGQYQSFNGYVFHKYHRDMTELIGRIRAIDATPILMTPTMFDARAARIGTRTHSPERLEFYNSVLAYYGTWLREVAVESGHGFVDMYGPLNDLTLNARKTDPNFTMIRDAVHPDPPGQVVMAYAIVSDMRLPRAVSNIRIVPRRDGKSNARVSGGKISELKQTESGVEFTWSANSLPWVVPEEAQAGAKLVRLGHRMSREALEVHGLPAGQYELSIDGTAVGIYSSTSLSRHIELQNNPKTPQYQQALEVAKLNKKRNDGPVKSLRNEWRLFQQSSRLKAQAKTDQQVAQLEALTEKLKGLDERVAKHQESARAIEDQIFEANRLKPRNYVLIKVMLQKTRGTILLDGKPLGGARVTFLADNGRTSSGTTNADGIYEIKTLGAPGAVSGKYRVAVTKDGIPKRYSDPKQTALQVEVKTGENVLNFDLTRE